MADYELRPMGVFHKPSGTVIRPQDEAWKVYDAWRVAGGVSDPQTPFQGPPQFDYVAAARHRKQRQIKALEKTDPLAAILLERK